jgi:4-amino-4-deoxy-L-arabinose transferase-like glycosyltransferase
MRAEIDLRRSAAMRANAAGVEDRMATRLAILSALILVAIAIRTLPLTYSHFWDETVFLQHARIVIDGRTNYNEFSSRPPLLPFMYAAGYAFWDSIYVANVVQGIVSGLMVLFAYLYVRPVFGTVAGIAAAALFAFTPYVVARSHDLLTDAPAVTLMLAAMWLFDRPGARSALLAGVVFSLAVQTRYTSLFLALYFVLDVIATQRKLPHLLLAGGAAILVVAPYLLWNYLRFGSPVFPFELAKRIVREWTALVPPVFYFRAMREIFPLTVWALFVFGIADLLWRLASGNSGAGRRADLGQDKRQFVLLTWGACFLAYMLTIPHKEVRYLLPLTIPVFVTAAVGGARIVSLVRRAGQGFRIGAVSLATLVIAVDFREAFVPLVHEPIDRFVSSEVEIAEYLRAHSSSRDTVYAAHNYPVFAFYTKRQTVSLLPFQDNFDSVWREQMNLPGFLVYTHPDQLGEIHSINRSLKPDRAFLDGHREFRVVREFPTATIYRYEP